MIRHTVVFRLHHPLGTQEESAFKGCNDHPDHVAFVRDRWLPEVAAFMEIDYVPLER